jgi:hypothetical protein
MKKNMKCPRQQNSNSNSPEQRTHLEFAKNQMLSSLESEQGHVRMKWKRQPWLMIASAMAGLPEGSGCRSFCSGLKGTKVLQAHGAF